MEVGDGDLSSRCGADDGNTLSVAETESEIRELGNKFEIMVHLLLYLLIKHITIMLQNYALFVILKSIGNLL
jgi:hypothetical protein